MILKVAVPERFHFKMVPTIKNLLFFNQGEIHYIGGADVLPPPLEAEEEAEVIRRLGDENDEGAKSKLIEHNLLIHLGMKGAALQQILHNQLCPLAAFTNELSNQTVAAGVSPVGRKFSCF